MTTPFKAFEPSDWRCPVGCGLGESKARVIKVYGGYSVQAYVPPAMSDDLWETIQHNVVWFAQADAQRLADRINAGDISKTGCDRWTVDLSHWTWQPSRCSAYGFMHSVQTFGQPLQEAA